MKYTSRDEAKNFLMGKLVAKNIYEEEAINAEIDRIVGLIPPSTRDDYNEDPIIAAAEYYPILEGAEAAAAPAVLNTAGTSITSHAELTTPALSDAQAQKLEEILEGDMENKIRTTQQTAIVALLARYEKPSTYLEGVTVIPECDEEKLAKYEENLVEDAENKETFQRIKAAIGTKPMPVYYNDKSVKIDGVAVSTPSGGEGRVEQVEIYLSNSELVGFLATKVLARIPSVKTKIGVQLRTIKGVKPKGSTASATPQVGAPQLKWVGKSAAINDDYDKMVVVTTERALDEAGKPLMKEKRVRIADSFKVYVEGTNQDGTRRTRTIRLSGKASVPVYKRISKFVEVLNVLSSEGIISAAMSLKEQAEAIKVASTLISFATNGQLRGSVTDYGRDLLDAVTKVSKTTTDATSAAASFA